MQRLKAFSRAVLYLAYPPQCLSCGALVGSDAGLCGACWRDTPFVSGLACDQCGQPLPGYAAEEVILCDDCLAQPRPWARGRAATAYAGKAQEMILALKHGDRTDLAPAAAGWLHRAAAPILQPDMLVTPVPLHWRRLFRRRYNQAALLSAGLARRAGLEHCPDLLVRHRFEGSQHGRGREARFANLSNAFRAHPRNGKRISDRHILLVDDVMTSGATLGAAAEACLDAGARQVSIAVLARVAKDT
jgi:ComF family protein